MTKSKCVSHTIAIGNFASMFNISNSKFVNNSVIFISVSCLNVAGAKQFSEYYGIGKLACDHSHIKFLIGDLIGQAEFA